MSRGNRVVLAYAPQTDIAVAPKTGWKTLPRTGDSLNHGVELTKSETINDSRIATAGMVTSAKAEGSVDVEMIKSTYDDLMVGAAFNPWNADVLTFGGNTQAMFALAKDYTDIAQYHYWSGMMVNKMSLKIPESGFITMNFDFMGSGYGNTTTAPYAIGTSSSPTAPKASTISVDSITIDGENLKGVACITDFSFEVDNGLERQNCIGGGLYGAKNLEMMANMSGDFTLAYSQKSQSILNKQLTGATIAITAVIKFPDGSSYALNIQKAQISGDVPNGKATDLLKAQMKYTVVEQAPTIIRVVTP